MCLYAQAYKYMARVIVYTTGRGEWFFAQHVPKGIRTLVNGYCGQYTFQVDTSYPIEACIWLYGQYDDMTMRFLRKYVSPGQVFVDVGANCGAFTLAAAGIMTGKGEIYAFEPGPTTLERLRTNLALNPALNDMVTLVPLGLGKQAGQLFYQEAADNRGNASLLHPSGTPVQVMTFDAWAAKKDLSGLDIIKIDVEGMEYDVLLGMHASLKKWHPVIYFETLEDLQATSGRSIKAIYAYLISLGYTIISGEEQTSPVPLDGPYPRNTLAL